MIVEMRTYTLQPGTVGQFEERFGAALAVRAKLAACRLLAYRGGPTEPCHPCLALQGFRDQLVHPRHEHILVVGPVEDHHLPPPRRVRVPRGPERVTGSVHR
jgi:hypothetical protein